VFHLTVVWLSDEVPCAAATRLIQSGGDFQCPLRCAGTWSPRHLLHTSSAGHLYFFQAVLAFFARDLTSFFLLVSCSFTRRPPNGALSSADAVVFVAIMSCRRTSPRSLIPHEYSTHHWRQTVIRLFLVSVATLRFYSFVRFFCPLLFCCTPLSSMEMFVFCRGEEAAQ